jgi:hypothetical protein
MTPSNLAREVERSSFRDNRGFVFWQDGIIYRQVNQPGRESYDQLMSGGLYQKLTERGLLVGHEELPDAELGPGGYKVIRPEQLAFISYPYEWSFSQLQDAALATLEIQKLALKHGMSLRDASAYNIQFVAGKPVMIDTLSFDLYHAGEPWIAYRQFCQHFLAPLTLMSKVDLDLGQLSRVYIDGVPLPLAAKLLPLGHKLKFGPATHLILHAKMQRQHEGVAKKPEGNVSATGLAGLIDSLDRNVRALAAPKARTEWGEYYQNTNYDRQAFEDKGRLVGEFLDQARPARVLDLGANDGSFSRIAADHGASVLSCDMDPVAVERNYQQVKEHHERQVLPLLIDLANPSANSGWANEERQSFSKRARSDAVLALALIHHLAIGDNLPLGRIAEYFAQLAPWLVIEFVPKTDSQVKRLLATREDIFPEYTTAGFEAAFTEYYETEKQQPVTGTERRLYLMKKRSGK